MGRHGELVVFARVVEDGNFSAAGRSLSLTSSTVSKLIKRLEDRLGALLFHRSGSSVTLTAEGKAFHEAALHALEALEAVDASVFSGRVARDTLRIRSMPAFGVSQLAPLVPAFCRLHPAIRLEIVLSMAPGHLLDGGIDVAIHVGPLPDSSLVARRFSGTRWIICAAPGYLAEYGTPHSPAELVRHECLNFLPDIPARPWTVMGPRRSVQHLRIASRIMSNQSQMLLELARGGAGVVQLTEFSIAGDLRSGALVELFPEWQSQDLDPVYAVYRSRRHVSPRIRVFLDFLEASFARSSTAEQASRT